MNRGTHVNALDGLRGIAILMVMVFHFSENGHDLAASRLMVDRLYYRLSGAGWIGVDLFFVLSGFLITGILWDAKGASHYFRNFYIRRALRIFPLYYAALATLLALPLVFVGRPAPHLAAGDAVWYVTYLSNVKMARAGWPSFTGLAHFWSLAVEEQFYLVWPLIVFVLNGRQLRVMCVAAVLMAFAARVALTLKGYVVAPYVLTPSRIDALAIGGFLALAVRDVGMRCTLSRWATPAALVSALAVAAMWTLREGFRADDPIVLTAGLTFVALASGALVALAVSGGRVAAWLARPSLRFFGKYSYAMYIFHYPILFFGAGIVPLEFLPQIHGSQLLRQFFFIACATTATTGLSLVSWNLLESRFLKLKNRFPYNHVVNRDRALVSEPIVV